jgi:hypothetical protein
MGGRPTPGHPTPPANGHPRQPRPLRARQADGCPKDVFLVAGDAYGRSGLCETMLNVPKGETDEGPRGGAEMD